MKRNKLLIIDDEENMRHMLKALLSKWGYEVTEASDGVAALETLKNCTFDLILCDIRMPMMDGLGFLRAAREYLKQSTVIMMSAYGTVDLAIEAMKLGAHDYISKPFKTDEVVLALKKAAERLDSDLRSRGENTPIRSMIREAYDFVGMIGKSDAMQKIYEIIEKAAATDTKVLIVGESGTGKEKVARSIHQISERRNKEFVPINCAALPAGLVESELFGHVRGAFTGADKDKKGLFEVAHGGTLFLDEVPELPPSAQAKLLRVIQENEIRPVGGNSTIRVDTRILSATSKHLEDEVALGRFREDLYYRLNVLKIYVPPLRERGRDILVLAQHFLRRFCRESGAACTEISPAVQAELLQYNWPGNVRQLENLMQRIVSLAGSKCTCIEKLPEGWCSLSSANKGPGKIQGNQLSIRKTTAMLEEELIREALARTGGNKTKAAELLEISYPSLLKKIKQYDLDG